MVKEAKPLQAKVMVCNGGDDKTITPKDQQAFEDEMWQAKADWTYVVYGGAMHAFTNPAADEHKDLGIVAYNESGGPRSWQLMCQFLAENA